MYNEGGKIGMNLPIQQFIDKLCFKVQSYGLSKFLNVFIQHNL